MPYEALVYRTDGPTATITLDGPDEVNTIVPPMLDELADAVDRATRDDAVKVIVLQGAGSSFCAGFNFSEGFHQWDDRLAVDGSWDAGRDVIAVTSETFGWVPRFMSLWRTPKPVIAKVHGWCLGGGSELALCADIVVTSEDARIGTPYSRMWGCHHAGMWVHRLGLAHAKEYALFGTPLSGTDAARIGLVNRAVPFAELHTVVDEMARQLAAIPASQLAVMKLVVNQAYENQGLTSTQLLGSVMDSMMRNTAEAKAFIAHAERDGVPAPVRDRDAPFADYSQAPPDQKPDRRNVITVER